MTSIIVKSGVNIIQQSCRWYNIHLTKTNKWDYATVKINNININTIYQKDHYNKIHIIEFNFIKNVPSLLVNSMIVYQNKNIFDFEVLIQLSDDTSITSLNELIVSREYKENNYLNMYYISHI